jgi:predicted HTH domain antitoxin
VTTITLDIPDEISRKFSDLEDLRRTVFEDLVIEQRQAGSISLGKAAELLGISYGDYLLLLGQKGLSFINADPGELELSRRRFQERMKGTE